MRSKSNLMSEEQTSVLNNSNLNNNNSPNLDNSNIILNRLMNEEGITQEEIERVISQEELTDKLGLIFKRQEEWNILKQAQITARDLFKLEKYKIALLLNHAEAIHYIRGSHGLDYSKERIVNRANEQKLLILLYHSKKMPILKEVGYLGRDIFELTARDLEDLLKQDAEDIELLGYNLSPRFFVHKVDNSANYIVLKSILRANKGLIIPLKNLGFEEEAIREMVPSMLSLLFEYIWQISNLQSLGYANEVIINELSEVKMRLLLSKSSQALEIAYDYPFTPSLIQRIGDEKLGLILNHIDNARVLFEHGFFKQIEFIDCGRLKLLLERSGEVGELIKGGLSVETIVAKPLKELNYLLGQKKEGSALSKPGGDSSLKIIMDVLRGNTLPTLPNILPNNWLRSLLSAPRLLGSYVGSNKQVIKGKDSKDSVANERDGNERGESSSVTNKKPLSSVIKGQACEAAKGRAVVRYELENLSEEFAPLGKVEKCLLPSSSQLRPQRRLSLLESEEIVDLLLFSHNQSERKNMHG